MDIRFLTLPRYNGKILTPRHAPTATGGAAAFAWQENASEGPYKPIFKKVRDILGERGEEVVRLAQLQYDDLNGFGNTLYRVDSTRQQYFLKILGDKQGNRREIFAWKILGYGKDGRRQPKQGGWIKGLPAEVFPMAPQNAVLTRYYPGQIHTIRGGSYEFPLVLALVLYLDETLRGMHAHGLMFMDLCPDNILYLEEDPSRPLLFFLTDMGSVKPITGKEGNNDDWVQLRDQVTAERWTRAEARPPDDLFPWRALQISEDHPGYDFHTLARTALLLLGFGQGFEVDTLDLSGYGSHFNIEQPFVPCAEEMAAFLQLLRNPLQGEPIDRQRLYDCFLNFFKNRAQFAASHFQEPGMRQRWQEQLQQRLQRYKMVLTPQDKTDFPEEVNAGFLRNNNFRTVALGEELRKLDAVCEHLFTGDLPAAVALLQSLAASELPDVSPTVNYALHYHAKLARAMAREQGNSLDISLNIRGSGLREELPETETLQALRQGRVGQLGILVRRIGF